MLIAISLLLVSWGNQGHKIISAYAFLSFNEEMSQFNEWKQFLVDHSSDADYRRDDIPAEGPKHYIDIDNYPEFVSNGKIAQDWQQLVMDHDYSFVMDNGTLPWATIATYDSLVVCFERRDWERAKIFAADLGHYVADGHMPMHITINYDGKLTGNSGIHSLYETSMIGAYSGSLQYPGDTLEIVENVSDYVFSYIYQNYPYVDSVLLADTYARTVSPVTTTAAYKAALWSKTGTFTIRLFSEASHKIAVLFYTAWVKAGRPLITGGTYNPNTAISFPETGVILNQVYPNPVKSLGSISYSIRKSTHVILEIVDSAGKSIDTLVNCYSQPGEYTSSWAASPLSPGIYFIVLKTDGHPLSQRFSIASE